MDAMAFTTRPTLSGSFGMTASTHYQATATAMSVLERGGNAADAACAAAFVLHVVEPHLNGPGGDAPIMISHRESEPQVLCGQAPAPTSATAAHYRDLGLDLVPGSGPLAAALPGAVDAWLVLLRDHGSWELDLVLEHAIGLAQHGHHPIPQIGQTVERVRDLFTQHWTSSAQVYLADGQAPHPDRPLANPALAATWQRLLSESSVPGSREQRIEAARRVWKQGFVAEAMVAWAGTPAMDSTGEPHAALWTLDDLAQWEPAWERPVSHSWGEWTVYKADQWTQGPSLLQQLALLEAAPGELETLADGQFSAATVHRLLEGTKLAMADRDAWYGDARPSDLAALLSVENTAARRALIGDHANLDWRPSTIAGVQPQVASHIQALLAGTVTRASAAGTGEPTVANHAEPEVGGHGQTRGDTCHLDVVDRWGTMISATPSGGWLQSNPVIPELGFPLGSRLQMAWLDEGLPNTLTPHRRPRTTLTPSLASYQGIPTLAFGTPGGDQQDQWSFHLFVRIAQDFARTGRLDLQAAVDAPNWHSDQVVESFWPRGYRPGVAVVEQQMDAEVIAGLRQRGHTVEVGPAWNEGRLSAVARHPHTGQLLAAANPRGMQGYAAGR